MFIANRTTKSKFLYTVIELNENGAKEEAILVSVQGISCGDGKCEGTSTAQNVSFLRVLSYFNHNCTEEVWVTENVSISY